KFSGVFALVMCCFLLQSVGLVGAQEAAYPTRPVTVLIPYGAGGTTDLSSRALIAAASKYLGERMIPLNKPGGGGTVAATAVMNAEPDGYTLGICVTSNAFAAPFAPNAPYKNLDGFVPLVNAARYVYPLIVTSDARWKTFAEFIDWARRNPGGAKLGISGSQKVTSTGLILRQLEEVAKVKFTYVSFKSSAKILAATLGKHIHVYASTFDATVRSYIKQGKLQVLCFADVKPIGFEAYPALSHLYGIVVPNTHGVWGPKALPTPIVKKLEKVFAQAVKDPDHVKVLEGFRMPIVYMNSEEMREYFDKTLQETEKIMKRLEAGGY
ncbi:MAG: tripartite tricarboxylate transporter substrate binding protein, partial [Candidatus Hodarchaeota archaeon]